MLVENIYFIDLSRVKAYGKRLFHIKVHVWNEKIRPRDNVLKKHS